MQTVAAGAPARVQALSEARVTIFFALTGSLAGLISAVISLTMGTGTGALCLILAVFLFYISYKLASLEKFRSRYLTASLPESEVKKNLRIITSGIWPFFILWLIIWVLAYTVAINFL
ncbi:MAG: hypothetical protein QXG10_03935 [Candidatus Hadarchaeales archaeon]